MLRANHRVESGTSGVVDHRGYDVFISYHRDSRRHADRVAASLETPIRKVWWDRKISSDGSWSSEIEDALERARCVVLIVSQKGLTSGWVVYEAYRAFLANKLVAITFERIDESRLPPWLAGQQITSLKDWRDNARHHEGWHRVSRAVGAKCSQLPEYKFKGWLGAGLAHKDGVASLAFHPTENARLISVGHDGTARLWLVTRAALALLPTSEDSEPDRVSEAEQDTANAKVAEWADPEGSVTIWRAQFSKDGRSLIVGSRSGDAYVLDAQTLAVRAALDHNKRCGAGRLLFKNRGAGAFRDGVRDATILDDGSFITVGGHKVPIWSPAGEFLRAITIADGPSTRLCRVLRFDFDGAPGLILADRLGKVRIIDPAVENGDQFIVADRYDAEAIIALAPDPEARNAGLLSIVSSHPSDAGVQFHTWSERAFSAGLVQPVFDDAPPIRALAMHPSSPVIAVGSSGVQPRLSDFHMSERIPLENAGWHERPITAVAFSASGKFLAAGSEDGRISIWEDISSKV